MVSQHNAERNEIIYVKKIAGIILPLYNNDKKYTDNTKMALMCIQN